MTFRLSERQRRACTSVQTGEPWFSAELGKELESLKYPLYFMDFESVNPAIPRFSGMRPFDQLPFQWSVHVQRQPDAEPEHYEFLATDSERPPTRVHHFAVWCTGRKRQHRCLRRVRIAAALGTRGVAARVCGADQEIQSRLWDLLPVVRNHVYHPAFAGSYSLKAVLPALVPEMSYDGMAVANGQDAGLAWESLVRGGTVDAAERERTRKALLELLRAGHAGSGQTPRNQLAADE